MEEAKLLVSMQDRLNVQTAGKDWKSQELNFARALRLEAAEAMESTPWKWWKKGTLDLRNLYIEAIDMLHFSISIAIMTKGESSSPESLVEECLAAADMDGANSVDLIKAIQERLDTIGEVSYVCYSPKGVSMVMKHLGSLFRYLGSGRDDIMRTYLGKSVLNLFRQKNGYKNGSYLKMWNGEEDNERMLRIVEELPVDKSMEKNIMCKLEAAYKEAKMQEKANASAIN